MGRNALTPDEKLALDIWYVGHWSLGMDLSSREECDEAKWNLESRSRDHARIHGDL
jgi:hypothetical protein